jgi:hypothetical protein
MVVTRLALAVATGALPVGPTALGGSIGAVAKPPTIIHFFAFAAVTRTTVRGYSTATIEWKDPARPASSGRYRFKTNGFWFDEFRRGMDRYPKISGWIPSLTTVP